MAVAKEFAAQGATVFLSGRRLAAISQVATSIHQDGGVAYAAEVDALDEQAVNAYLDRVAQEGSIDILLNVVGPQPKDYGNGSNTLELPLEQFLLPLATLVPSQLIHHGPCRSATYGQAALRSHPVCHSRPSDDKNAERYCHWRRFWCHGSAREMSGNGSGASGSPSSWHSFRGHSGDQSHPAGN